jgi:thiamine kinase-like enzyme
MLASRPDWNGWLTREVRGSLLSDTQEQALWEKAAATLARLQIQSMDCGSQILAAGARDLGPAALSNLIRPFLDVVAQLMERQTTAPPPILSRKDLLLLAESLQSAVETMEAAGIPEALGHLDLNPGNIIVSPNQSVFLDWAEAYVGNPLLSFEYLSEHFRRFVATDPALQEKLMEFYTDPWRRIVSPAAITEALNASRFLAVFAYAAGTRMHCDQERLRDAKAAGYLRALTRRMHREAIQFNSRRSACLG